jgi:phosphatidate cytidylyltransferase
LQAPRWGDLPKRFASAAILLPLAVFCLWQGGWAWELLIGAAALGLAMEWISLCGRNWLSPAGLSLIVCVLAVWAMAVHGNAGAALTFALVGVPVVWRMGHKAPRALSLAAGLPYIGCATLALIWLRANPGSGLANVLLVLLVVWASDIGAYLVGRTIGGRKLAPAISPGKTRSGAIGGLLAACLVGVAAAFWLDRQGDLWWLVAMAAGLSVVSQAGDLLESFIKRRFGVKDSGWLIPGHGGLFDRLDGLLAAAPAAAALAFALGRGVVLSP